MGKVRNAIEAYNKALKICPDKKQEGIILLLRASAYLQQAYTHKTNLQDAVQGWNPPETRDVQSVLSAALVEGPERSGLANSILQTFQVDGRRQQVELRKIQYRHGLYQYSLLCSVQDSLRATELLPTYANSWLQAGDVLSELWKLNDSQQYYEKAISLDGSLRDDLQPVLKNLVRRQELLDEVRSIEDWPEDSLRLALDVAG